MISLVNNDSELKRGQRGTGSKRGTVPISRIRKFREDAGCQVNVTPIDQLTDDYTAVIKNRRIKISEVVLRYLKDKRIIKGQLFAVYKIADDRPENRSLTITNVIEDVNMKFLEMYDKA